MKKLVAISIIAGLMLGIAGVAMAAGTATNWLILVKGSDTTYTNAAGLIQLGTNSTAVNGKGTEDVKYTANTGNQAQVVAYEPTFSDTPPFYNKDLKAPINWTTQSVSWDLLVWAGPNYVPGTIRLSWWSTSTGTPVVPAGYEITLEQIGGTAKLVWTPGALGSSTAPAGFIDLPAVKIADAAAVDGGYKFKLTVAPIPEPSSLAALATGLFGLAGFAIRRRK